MGHYDDKKDEFNIEDAEFGFGTGDIDELNIEEIKNLRKNSISVEDPDFNIPDFLKTLKIHDFSEGKTSDNKNDDIISYNKIMDKHSMISISDHTGHILHISDAFCKASKYDRNEIIGKAHSVFKSGKHDDVFYKKLWDTVSNGDIWEGQICNRAKDGSLFWLQTTILPFKGKGGKISHYISIRNNITSQKNNEKRIKDERHQAEQANSCKTAFLGKVSHELRTPLNAVLGFTELLESGVAGELNNDSQREYVSQIRKGGEQLLQLVSDLVDMSKIESGNITLYEDDIELCSLLRDELERVTDFAKEYEVEVKLEMLNEPVLIKADNLRLRQVLMNITSNAIKFSHNGGIVKIKLIELPDHHAKIIIEDKGIGMDEAEMNNIFKPFQQSENKLISYQDGLGLGLTIAQYFISLMGGKIMIESEKSVGTKVTISL